MTHKLISWTTQIRVLPRTTRCCRPLRWWPPRELRWGTSDDLIGVGNAGQGLAIVFAFFYIWFHDHIDHIIIMLSLHPCCIVSLDGLHGSRLFDMRQIISIWFMSTCFTRFCIVHVAQKKQNKLRQPTDRMLVLDPGVTHQFFGP